jgi:hypothetical protein
MGYWIVTVTKARPDSTNLGNVKVYFKAKQSDQEDLSLEVDDTTDSADFDLTITINPTVKFRGKDYPVYPDTVVVRGNSESNLSEAMGLGIYKSNGVLIGKVRSVQEL